MKKLKQAFFNRYAAGAALLGATAASHADMSSDISAAFTGATSNVTLAAGGVVALVAVVTGISLIVSLLRK
ncbi:MULTISPECIES: hypothetical protein [Methylomicrobium]|uniref:Bacteriophage coat protein B n=1 Tax=Methylomicrobium album BG8 TaxID=686340 RepID=H8GQL2_METAL|nr:MULTISPECIES: hypothetical protein [Methylomicrobium]EIC29839.1 hypothetical protein Metal_2082 [Methylomicrobium album BG8]